MGLQDTQNLPPQVILSDPVVVDDALDGYFPFFLDHITCAEVSVNFSLKAERFH
jgi:hypothetical protein